MISKILSIDYGCKRTGLAVTDILQTIAFGKIQQFKQLI